MKLDILKNSWVDIVFEGRNKVYGAYELRKSNTKTTTKALILGAIFFSVSVAAPLIIDLIPKGDDSEMDRDIKITTIKFRLRRKKNLKSYYRHLHHLHQKWIK